MPRRIGDSMASLIDIKVLVALMHGKHRHSGRALQWLDEQTESVGICRVVQMGVLRLLTRTAVMDKDVLSPPEFWKGWDEVMADERFAFVEEPSGVEAEWRKITAAFPKEQCAETDTYLAAFAQSAGLWLVTFDQGFRRFPEFEVEILS